MNLKGPKPPENPVSPSEKMKLSESSFDANITTLVDGMFKVMSIAQPSSYCAWDSFAGRTVWHEETLEEAQKKAVRTFLREIFKP